MSYDDSDTDILRCAHDKENPYAQINRDLIRNKSLSPRCRWFIIYCLSYSKDWKISIPYFIRDQEISKDIMYKMLDEAIEAGYMMREERLVGGLKKYRYFISEIPRFKKCLPCLENPDTVFPDTENPDTTKEQLDSSSEESITKKQQKKGSTLSTTSADADRLCEFFILKIKERIPNFKDPNIKKWKESFDKLLRIDKREISEVERIIVWASMHKWWKSACLCPDKLRQEYDRMFIEMEAGKEKDTVKINRSYAVSMKEKYPKQLSGMTFDEKFVMNRSTGKDISLNMNTESFKRAFASLFGGRHE